MAARLDPAAWALPAALAALAALIGALAGIQPPLAIGAAVAAGFLVMTLTSLTAGLIGFTVLTFLELVPSLTGPAVSMTKVAGAVLAVSWVATVSSGATRRQLFPSAHPYLTAVLLLFIGWTLLSLAWAESQAPVIVSTTSFALNFALFPIVYSALTSIRDARWLIVAFVAGAVIAGFYGVIAQPNAGELASSPVAAAGLNRLSGTIGDPNELASLLVAGLALSSALIANQKLNGLARGAALAAAAILLLGALMTLSRGGLVALAAALTVSVLVAYRHRLRALLIAGTVAAVALVALYVVTSPEARDRITATDGGSGRTDIWDIGWRMVEDKPIVGVGAGNFQVSSIHYLLAPGSIRFDEYIVDQPAVAHNAYLEVLAETGVIGLVLFCGAIGGSIATAVRAGRNFSRSRDREGELIARAVLIAIGALLAAYFFLSEEHSKHLWLLLSLGPALLAISRESAPPDAPA